MITVKRVRVVLLGAIAASLAAAAPASAQDSKDLPTCSATVTDHCMQKGGHAKMHGHGHGAMMGHHHRTHHGKAHKWHRKGHMKHEMKHDMAPSKPHPGMK